MVKKIKKKVKQLKNEKGFTLVELLAVIVILGIIVAIAVPAIGNIIGDARSSAEEAEIELILDAARLADASEQFEDGMDAEALQEAGFLDGDPDEFPTGTITREDNNTFIYNE